MQQCLVPNDPLDPLEQRKRAAQSQCEIARAAYENSLQDLEKAMIAVKDALLKYESVLRESDGAYHAPVLVQQPLPGCMGEIARVQVVQTVKDDTNLVEPWGVTSISEDVIAVVVEELSCVHLYSFSAKAIVKTLSEGLLFPMSLALVSAELLVISDSGNNRLCVWNWRENSCQRSIGLGIGTGLGQFHHPQGVCAVTTDRIAVADRDNHRVQVFCWSDGRVLNTLGGEHGKGAGPRQFNSPQELCLLSPDTLLVSDVNNYRIHFILWESGVFVKFIATVTGVERIPWAPTGIALLNPSHIVASDRTTNALHFIRVADGETVHTLMGDFDFPAGIAVVGGGKALVVVDRLHNSWHVLSA